METDHAYHFRWRERKDAKFPWSDYAENICNMIVQHYPNAIEALYSFGGTRNGYPSRNDHVLPMSKFNGFFVNVRKEDAVARIFVRKVPESRKPPSEENRLQFEREVFFTQSTLN